MLIHLLHPWSKLRLILKQKIIMWKLNYIDILCQKIGHIWIKDEFIWQWKSRRINCFVRNYNIKLESPGILTTMWGSNIYVLYYVVRLYENSEICAFRLETQWWWIWTKLCLGTYFFTANALSKQKHAMRCIMSKRLELKNRRYAACMDKLNEYLYIFTGGETSEK